MRKGPLSGALGVGRIHPSIGYPSAVPSWDGWAAMYSSRILAAAATSAQGTLAVAVRGCGSVGFGCARGPECPCTKWCRIPRGRRRRWCGCARNAPPFLLCVGAVIAEEQARGHARAAQRTAHFRASRRRRRQTTTPDAAPCPFQSRVLRERKQHRLRAVVALEKIRSLRAPHALSSESLLHDQGKAAPAAFFADAASRFGCCSSNCTIFPRRR